MRDKVIITNLLFFRVTLLASAELAYYCIRTLRLERIVRQQFQTTPSLIPYRDIKHLQFTAWPDHGVPSHPTPFLTFLKRVRAMNAQSVAPIVVHCRLKHLKNESSISITVS